MATKKKQAKDDPRNKVVATNRKARHNFKILEKGAKALGLQEVHTGNMAINSAEYDERMACQQTGFCFQGCKWGAKWSAAYTDIPKGEATGNLARLLLLSGLDHDAEQLLGT